MPSLRSITGRNTPEQQAKHYVVLVSLDGFRFDYAQKYHAENILGMMQNGANAPHGMIPAYPSVTVPNHYTIVTGLYPEHHGIVGNQFYDPTRKELYFISNPQDKDGRYLVRRRPSLVAGGTARNAFGLSFLGLDRRRPDIRPTAILLPSI